MVAYMVVCRVNQSSETWQRSPFFVGSFSWKERTIVEQLAKHTSKDNDRLKGRTSQFEDVEAAALLYRQESL